MVSEVANLGAGDGCTPEGSTTEDLRLDKKATNFLRTLSPIALVACVAIAGFVCLNVPWDTRMPYDGKYDRSGNGIPMQIAMLPCMLLLVGIWRAGTKPDAHHMRKGSRVGTYILGGGLTAVCVFGQWVIGESILEAGGYLVG